MTPAGVTLKRSVNERREREAELRAELRTCRRAYRRHDYSRFYGSKRNHLLAVRRLRKLTIAAHTRTVVAEKRLSNYRKAIHKPLRLRAFDKAESLVGVMEQGGNNTGPVVDRIIHENNGSIGEPWCGDFVAFCYRAAGSKTVQRGWASVSFLFANLLRRSPRKGDVVTYVFSHTGLFEKDLGNGYIQTIEGNTGSSGAVSDSSTGGDGVYRKQRSKSLVSGYRRVPR